MPFTLSMRRSNRDPGESSGSRSIVEVVKAKIQYVCFAWLSVSRILTSLLSRRDHGTCEPPVDPLWIAVGLNDC